ncbi:MAG: hypothetical protein CVU17_08240 [Betaproteobacteria bacterium HGW-Betaproteobacteria-11]|nr:MAG: hypothetical protein CVU17_08240 [Betaproteobacteria bacterium HGW-Betaproteobacteria-11]
MMDRRKWVRGTAIASAATPALAWAHAGVGAIGGFGAGFVLATALLHGLGLGTALLFRQRLRRLAGVAIALSGIYFAYA